MRPGDPRGRPLAAGGVASTPRYSGLTHRSEPLPRHRIALPFLLIFEAVPALTKWKPVSALKASLTAPIP